MLKLNLFRDQSQGLSDLLQYASVVDDGVLLQKDGGLVAGFFYHGNDPSNSTVTELQNLSARVNAALKKFGNGWMIHVDAIRMSVDSYPMPENTFPDPVSQAIDDERRAMFKQYGNQFETVYALLVTYLPPFSIENKVYTFLVDDPEAQKSVNVGNKHLKTFKDAIEGLQADVSSELRLKRMRGEEFVDDFGKPYILDRLLQYINFAVTGDNHPIRLPSQPMYIDALLGYRDFQHGLLPKVGEKYVQTIAVDGFPGDATPTILTYLGLMPIEYRWSSRFIFMDRHEAMSELGKYRRKWKQKVRGFVDQLLQTNKSAINQDALQKLAETEEAIRIVESGDANYGYYTSVIVLMGEDRAVLEEQAKEVKKTVQDLGFSCRIEGLNNTEAWLGTLPGHAFPNVRRPLINTLNLSDLLPLAGIWAGSEYCPSPKYPKNSPALMLGVTGGNTPFRINTFVDDLGHFLVFGGSGAGKSVFLAMYVAQFLRYLNARVVAFDKNYSQYALCKGVGGDHYDIDGPNEEVLFCPLSDIDKPSELSWAIEFIEKLCILQGMDFQSHHRNAVDTALKNLSLAKSKTLTEFVATVQNLEVREALQYYTMSGPMGRLLDSDRQTFSFQRYSCFEISKLINLKNDKISIPVFEVMFHQFENSLNGDPTLLIIDEGWAALMHPDFRAKFIHWVFELRKQNCIVGFATQSPKTLAKSGILEEIRSSIGSIIFLANPDANEKERAIYSDELGLSDRQIDIIAGMQKKRDYMLLNDEGCRVFQLGLGHQALKYCAVSGVGVVNRLRELIKSNPKDWRSIWEKEA